MDKTETCNYNPFYMYIMYVGLIQLYASCQKHLGLTVNNKLLIRNKLRSKGR